MSQNPQAHASARPEPVGNQDVSILTKPEDNLDLTNRGDSRHLVLVLPQDHRGIGDIDVLTVRENLALSRSRQLFYRLYRHPLVMLGIGPSYNFVLRQRLPVRLMRSGWQPWASAMSTNTAIATLIVLLIWLVGVGPFLLVQLPITFLGATIGAWLFYVQHQFEDTRDGASYREITKRVRTRIATELLTETSLPISSIGAQAGYANPALFSRAFARDVGVSPTTYRNRVRSFEE